ncbi:MAG: HAD family hydrolase [Thermodesulfobacteriota bacterium]|nr:HAD family hydrolase [Thermodesulfobacteriota bacterium]
MTGVFLDRDDTIIKNHPYLSDPQGVELLPKAARGIALLNEAGLPVIMVTNQSGIARGLLDEKILHLIHERLDCLLRQQGAHIDGIYYCPHHPEAVLERYKKRCICRKPATGMLLKAASDFGLNLDRSYMAGDKALDIETIHRAGGKGVLVSRHKTRGKDAHADHVSEDLMDAAWWILGDRL